MNTQQLAQLTPPMKPSPAYAAAWWLHLYDGRAYFTFAGKIVAVATCTTPDEETRLIVLLDRLTTRTSQRHR
ncbi:MAG: hypothetical protein M3Y74_06040 [Chloroflexota bacterium]|nr:hypothetical protein [Chloroflexota bacterium]